MGYYFRLAVRVLLYASSHRQDNTYHGLCYTSRGEIAQWVHHEESIRRPIHHERRWWCRQEREIAQWVHPIMDRSDDPSHQERTLLPQIYISLPKRQSDKTKEITIKELWRCIRFRPVYVTPEATSPVDDFVRCCVLGDV